MIRGGNVRDVMLDARSFAKSRLPDVREISLRHALFFEDVTICGRSALCWCLCVHPLFHLRTCLSFGERMVWERRYPTTTYARVVTTRIEEIEGKRGSSLPWAEGRKPRTIFLGRPKHENQLLEIYEPAFRDTWLYDRI